MQISHLREETESWKRYLDFIKSENVLLKSRLYCSMQDTSDLNYQARADIYRNQLAISDEMLIQLSESIDALESLQADEALAKPAVQKQLLERQRTLRDEVGEFGKYYFTLRSEYNAFMTERFV